MSSILPTDQFKRKYPRRVYFGYVGVFVNGQYFLTQCTSLGEGGLSFVYDLTILINSQLVVTFKIPGDTMISVRGELKNSRKNRAKESSGKLIFGIQFLPLPIGERRRIRAYVSARSEDEPII